MVTKTPTDDNSAHFSACPDRRAYRTFLGECDKLAARTETTMTGTLFGGAPSSAEVDFACRQS